jgi:hypothetical protein
LWLLKSLMDAVKQMNAGSSSVNESPLRMVKTLILTGGDGTKVPSGIYATAATDSSSEGGAPPANFASDEGGASGGSANFSFPYTSELGIGGDGNKTVGGGDYASLDAGAEVSVDGAAAAEKPGLRYVGPQEGDVLSLQRGFYMEVVIDHRKIQDFIVNLTNCSFPVKINRYQFAIRNNLNPLATRKLAAPNPFARRGAVPGVAELPKTSSESAMSASYLANLAICGQMAIFTPPAHLPEATGPIPADPNAQPAATTPTTETSTPPTEMPAETPTPDKPATSDAPPASQEGGNPPVINNGSPGSPMQEENKAPMAPNEKPLEDKIPVEKIPAEKSPSTEPTPPNQPTETPPAAS